MPQWHYDELQQFLARKGWRVVAEQEGDGYRTALIWQVQRSTRHGPFHLEFEAMDELEALPPEEAYAVSLRESPSKHAYFYRKGNPMAWQEALSELALALDALESSSERRD